MFAFAGPGFLAVAGFHWSGHREVAEIQDAYKLLDSGTFA
jgi:hypothetical protein